MSVRVNEYNQPIGKEIVGEQKSVFPDVMNYVGEYTIVTNLAVEHIEPLYEMYRQSSPSNWTYLFDEFPQSLAVFEELMLKKIADELVVYYVVKNRSTEQPLGIFSLMRIDLPNAVVEVGNVNFSDALRKTQISTEAHYLLAKYVFEQLHFRRYEWKCDALNAPSMKTAKRLGFIYEGLFRHAVIYKNRSRDTAWFSMLAEEWPANKSMFEKWLAKDNFDEHNMQVKKLEQCK